MPTLTTNYSLQKPLVNSATDQDLWGNELNTDLDSLDTLMRAGITIAVQASQTTGFTAGASISLKRLYPCDATGGAFAPTLPAAATAGNGATVYFKKTDSSTHAVTVTAAGSDTIDGAATIPLSAQHQSIGVVSDGVSAWSLVSQTEAPSTSLLIFTQKITSSGTYFPHAGMVCCVAEGVGSGGSASGGTATGGGGTGGGGGAYGRAVLTAADIGASKPVTIGAAAPGGAASTQGADGATTSLGTLLVCAGGSKGPTPSGGGNVTGGVGGVSTGAGDLKVPGQPGGIGGGGSYAAAGAGGDSWFGRGGQAITGNNLIGKDGTGYGAGGGGGTGNQAGGASTAGVIFITEYCMV